MGQLMNGNDPIDLRWDTAHQLGWLEYEFKERIRAFSKAKQKDVDGAQPYWSVDPDFSQIEGLAIDHLTGSWEVQFMFFENSKRLLPCGAFIKFPDYSEN
jgi:hypothetical protein